MGLNTLLLAFIICSCDGYLSNRRLNRRVQLQDLRPSPAPWVQALLDVEPTLKHRFFFPGHSNQFIPPALSPLSDIRGMFKYDLPELDGLDNIHNPEGPLLEALVLAAKYFKAYQTWFLVNGSTNGILTAMLACSRLSKQQSKHSDNSVTQQHCSRFIVGRDSHKSVFDGLQLTESEAILLPCYSDSVFGISLGVDFTKLEEILIKYQGEISGLIFSRPTYHGVGCSNELLQQVVDLCHTYEVPVIVDEAHGSHLHLLNNVEFGSALSCGADLVIQSSHKTLSSLSQTAMLHLNHNAFAFHPRIDTGMAALSLHAVFSALTTTSPNSLLLASLDATRAHLHDEGESSAAAAIAAIAEIRSDCRCQSSKVVILDDSVEVRQLGLHVDPLRLTVHFACANNQDVDDSMCASEGIYCELNMRSCISFNIPVFSSVEYLVPLRHALATALIALPNSGESRYFLFHMHSHTFTMGT
jgi:arginine/lysine/ornithine decarboxylase